MNSTVLLSDVPRCLRLSDVFVGDPAVRVVASPGWRDAWRDRATPTDGAEAFRRDAVEQCLDLVGVLRGYREPQDGEHWRTPAGSEERLLAQVSAILGLGGTALHHVRALAIDEDLPDPGRVFAALFVLGCVEGSTWLEAIREVFVTAVARHPQEAAAAVEALCLAPNPGIADLLHPLLADERWRLRAAAVRVLAYREALDDAAWRHAAQDLEPGVAQAALGAPLWRLDPGGCETVLASIAARTEAPEALVAAALRAGATHGMNALHGIALKRAAHSAAWADALHAVALHGRPEDAPLLRAALGTGDRWLAVRAAGRLGAVSLMPDLVGLLLETPCTPEEAKQLHAAIHAISGLPVDAKGVWRQTWHDRAEAYREDRRYIEGQEAAPRWLLSLLCAPTAARPTRQALYASLCLAARTSLPRFNAYDFVGEQVQALCRIGAALGISRSAAEHAAAEHAAAGQPMAGPPTGGQTSDGHADAGHAPAAGGQRIPHG
ncbi:hypothetical protein [Mitsuaria sp. 7]|uniref:hypothetical protein n=1 Tax=Mitsuaria sp. 7 TaxID=1658665 RepID=UPI0007DD7EEA|nr:hypothetical protein [Mitsuaria sp. 7]ANH67321.1 hypothetical protein ABE85_06615 [Mitsuaria sp. 7]